MNLLNSFPSRSDSSAAPNAPDSSVASVTPIWTEERNLFGSWASRAARWPRLPCLVRARIWPSRKRDERHLGGGEEAADQYHGKDEENIPADAIHVRIPDPRQFGVRDALPSPRPGSSRNSAAR